MIVRFLLSVICMLLCLSAVSCISSRAVHSLGGKRKIKQQASLKKDPSYLVTWNIHKAKNDLFTNEAQELLQYIPQGESLILCFQEVRSSTYGLIKDSYTDEVSGYYAPSWRYPLSSRSTGVMTIGSSDLIYADAQQLLTEDREFAFVSPKVSLLTELRLSDGRTLQVMNCHGLNFVSGKVFDKQLEQIFDKLKSKREPAIVCGDFNVWSARRLESLQKKVQQAGMQEAVDRSPSKAPSPAWIKGLKGLHGFDPDLHLDRIFTRGVKVLDCYSIEGTKSSDHTPLLLRFEL